MQDRMLWTSKCKNALVELQWSVLMHSPPSTYCFLTQPRLANLRGSLHCRNAASSDSPSRQCCRTRVDHRSDWHHTTRPPIPYFLAAHCQIDPHLHNGCCQGFRHRSSYSMRAPWILQHHAWGCEPSLFLIRCRVILP